MQKFFMKKIIIVLLVLNNQNIYSIEILRAFAGPVLLNAIDKKYPRPGRSGNGNSNNDIPNLTKPSDIQENLDSVIVEDEVKYKLKEVIEYLNHPEKFKSMGVKSPKGILFYGPPGTGKTSLGRALAKEAKCNFFYIAGSEVDDMWVGTGASKIQDLFNSARRNTPAVIFIDEIDTIAKKRSSLETRHHTQTIQQLLVEMDGFSKQNLPVIVIATTNKKNQLDEAILRSGRFDVHIAIENPSLENREKILARYLKSKPFSKNISNEDLKELSEKMYNFSGADIENLVNQAGFLAIRENKKNIELSHLKTALNGMIKQKQN